MTIEPTQWAVDMMMRLSIIDQIEPRLGIVGRGRSAATVALGQVAHGILAESQYPMTLRQLYYRLVSVGAIPKTEAGYGKLKRLIVGLREDGTVPWDWLVDHTRAVFAARTWVGIEDLLNDTAKLYRRDLMHQQEVAVQLWAESDSIGSVVAPVADRYCIPTFIGRGYAARGYLWSAARDAVGAYQDGKNVVILHIGDFDPSGVDIFRDVEETLRLYALAVRQRQPVAAIRSTWSDRGVRGLTDWLTFERLALTQEQVDQYHLPARPPKMSDTRTAKFVGRGTVEVEALPVDALLSIVEQAIVGCIDMETLRVAEVAEASEREIAQRIAATPVDRLMKA
jgi:hypothetical protein